ncbi:hypothetical protein PanWU01x14_102810 [Parasponia andersonii]|uniref:Uncharacterized protein n=1 Tax=Parasponia andersonii TaxID=3476 RepID=A0A2P5D2H8_PARAD|nr:hypothetical protein PanWU01x14_102810 [Parasponia andersonii]
MPCCFFSVCPDSTSLHGSCPQWSATRWIYVRKYDKQVKHLIMVTAMEEYCKLRARPRWAMTDELNVGIEK